MADIAREIADIELAVRGEEVRDSIVNALNKPELFKATQSCTEI